MPRGAREKSSSRRNAAALGWGETRPFLPTKSARVQRVFRASLVGLYVRYAPPESGLDGVCPTAGWLTLGRGTTAQSITTDDRGTGRESLFRDVSAIPVGTTFDIWFRVVNVATQAVVLTSDCYRYTISQ